MARRAFIRLKLRKSSCVRVQSGLELFSSIMTDVDDDPLRKRIKAHDLRICIWNVRSLNNMVAISQLETVIEAYKTDIIALQEMRWTGQE